jgi:radical SAM protein with 4Fe4S-binding SPASM domain
LHPIAERATPADASRRNTARDDTPAPVRYTSAMLPPGSPPAITWSRPEPFGAWIRLDDATLLAVDHDLAERLGVPHGKALGKTPRPLELHLAVTSRCPLPCEGCYLDARPDGDEPPFEAIAAHLSEARAAGVSLVAFGGGEPLTRLDLGRIAAEARRLGLVPVLTTSGFGLTAARAEELRAFAQINVSHDGEGDGYESVRGFDGAGHAERAIRLLTAAGIPTGVNLVLTRGSFPRLEASCERFADLGAMEVQLLRYKPAGRARGPGYDERRLSPGEVSLLWPTITRIIVRQRLRVRIDCAMVPLLSSALLASVPDAPAALAALGVFGCEAARHLGATRADGSVAACSLFSRPESTAPIGLRRRREREAPEGIVAWDVDPMLAAFRAYHAAPPEPCRSCALFPVCRGGCQVISRHAQGGAFAPDPECPRVLEQAAGASR